MASCDVFPTLTTAQVSNSQSLVTTSTQFVSTAPGSVSTVVVSTCAQVGSSASCLPTVTTSFITSPGAQPIFFLKKNFNLIVLNDFYEILRQYYDCYCTDYIDS